MTLSVASIFGTLTQEANTRVGDYLRTLDFGPLAVLDFLIVGGLLYALYRSLRETRALGIIYGILVLIMAFVGARVLRLELLSLLIANVLTLLFVAIPVLFQPELRRLLERLGRTRSQALQPLKKRLYSQTVAKVAEAARVLSQNKTGALMVFKRTTGLTDLSTAGTTINADVSTPLLLNLFYDKSPLHDGAVVIDRDKVISAGTMLPLSEREYGYTLGSRHRAAVGLTEQSDAVVLVVSEERGIISLVVAGKITPGIKPDILPQILQEFLTQKSSRDIVRRLRQRQAPKTGKAASK